MQLVDPLHITLWKGNRAWAEECLVHPFVRGLADGNLDRDAFKQYVAQLRASNKPRRNFIKLLDRIK